MEKRAPGSDIARSEQGICHTTSEYMRWCVRDRPNGHRPDGQDKSCPQQRTGDKED